MNLAYVAGLLDGEGTVGFTRSRNGGRKVFVPRVSIVNTNLELLEALRKVFGGWIGLLSGRKSGWKRAYSWTLANATAVAFARKLSKWVRLKSNQCWLICAWDEIRPGSGGRWGREQIAACSLLNRQSKWLNWRGTGRPVKSPIDTVLAKIKKA